MAQAREVVPVMDAKTTPKRAKAGSHATQTRKGLGGPYGASFTGVGTRGLTFERRWTRPGVHPYDEITWEYRTAGISSETGSCEILMISRTRSASSSISAPISSEVGSRPSS